MPKHNIPEELSSVNVTVGEEFSEIERLVEEVAELWQTHTLVDVQIKFKIGDRMRKMNAISAAVTRSAVTMRFGKGLWRQFKQCGWVAYRWRDLNSRQVVIDEEKPWSYFRDNDPLAGVIYAKKKAVTFFLGQTMRHEQGDGYYANCIGGHDREITVRIPESILEEVLSTEGWHKN